jgi:Integrase core domain
LALTAVARNGYVESINSRIRDQCPTINGFWSLAQARVVTERLTFAWTNLRGPATATGRRRTDPYSVILRRAAGASRGA